MKVELEEGEWKSIEELRVVDLRGLLGKYDLSKTGTKPILLKRLETYLQEIEDKKRLENKDEGSQKEEEGSLKEEEGSQEEEEGSQEEEEPVPETTPRPDSPLMLEADMNDFKEEVEDVKPIEEPPKAKEASPHKEVNREEKEEEPPAKNGEEETPAPFPKPNVPFRKLSKSISKEERKPRTWSNTDLPEESVEAVSTESLKDIIPDLKPLLETTHESGLEDGIEEEKEKVEKVEEEPPLFTVSEEGEIPSKRPRIDPPSSSHGDENETEVLLIRHLVRPFTLTQLKELLKRTGTVEDFWINKIKSHCFVRFSKVEEASETRVALDGVKWPNSNPKTLSVTFSTRKKMEETAEENASFEAPLKNDDAKEGGLKAAPLKEKVSEIKESSVKPQLLDDLFRKTKTTPCIYWTVNEKSLKKGKEERKKVEVVS